MSLLSKHAWREEHSTNLLASQAVEVHEPELILQHRTWQNLQRRNEELQSMPSHLILLLLMTCNSPQFYQPGIHRSIDMHIQTQNMLNTASLKLYQSFKMQSLQMNNMKGTMAKHQVCLLVNITTNIMSYTQVGWVPVSCLWSLVSTHTMPDMPACGVRSMRSYDLQTKTRSWFSPF